MKKRCEWCGQSYEPGNGDWGRPQSGRYAQRPGRFCSQPCSYTSWRIAKGKLSPEQTALRLLQRNHRAEFDRLLVEEQARRHHSSSTGHDLPIEERRDRARSLGSSKAKEVEAPAR